MQAKSSTKYPSDLKDEEWAVIADLFRSRPLGGRPPKYSRREILNAVFYIAKTGSQWRYLPKDFPPWHTVYMQFLRWRDSGKIKQVYDFLHRKLRVSLERHETPSVGIIDSQSIKTTEKRGLQVSMQGKKLKEEKDICL